MSNANDEILASVRGRLEQANKWKTEIGQANELRCLGWVMIPPPALLSSLAQAAAAVAEKELAAEKERLREVAAAEERAEAQRQDRVVFMKTGVATKAEWDQKLAESKKSDKATK